MHWFVRNEWVHAERWIRGDVSVNFLVAYWESLSLNSPPGMAEDKGKQAVSPQSLLRVGAGTRAMKPWKPPEEDWIKVNVDGAFVEQTGKTGVGVAIRDQKGTVLLSAWMVVHDARLAEEVEAQACREG